MSSPFGLIRESSLRRASFSHLACRVPNDSPGAGLASMAASKNEMDRPPVVGLFSRNSTCQEACSERPRIRFPEQSETSPRRSILAQKRDTSYLYSRWSDHAVDSPVRLAAMREQQQRPARQTRRRCFSRD
eukprot:3053170-Pyramimonas_sp.AAC.1